MQTFNDLQVWKRSHAVVLELYSLTKQFPSHQLYGLTSKIQRAAVSIPANLAEGCKRSSRADFGRFVAIARGSAGELDYLLLLANELGYLESGTASRLRNELDGIQRMLTSLYVSLSRQ